MAWSTLATCVAPRHQRSGTRAGGFRLASMAAYDDFTPVAPELVVFRDERGWHVHFDQRDYGPYPFRSAAVRAAIETARLARGLGHAAHVREVVPPSRTRTLWSHRNGARTIP